MRENFSPEFKPISKIYQNLSTEELQQLALSRGEGLQLSTGAVDISSRPYTGRSPKDTFVVSGVEDVDYGQVNQPIDEEVFRHLFQKGKNHLSRQNSVFVQERSVGAVENYNVPVTLISECASAAQFANIMFLPRLTSSTGDQIEPYSILHVPSFKLNGGEDGVSSEAGIITSLQDREMLIAGTGYLGEIKKRMFWAMQYELARKGVATMHCSANMGEGGDVALFFGLSGTGKTTLSNSSDRVLIGDDEHGWSDEGVFNFENGSYAKLINLSEQFEPGIYHASRQKGGISENGTFDLYLNPIYTYGEENMRGAFPLSYMERSVQNGQNGHPRNIFLLTADGSGVIPPISELNPEEAIFQYLMGYTSKVAGTERGVAKPVATFSACYGSPFLPLPAERYAELLRSRIKDNNPRVWLVNTGWPGGYENSERMSIAHTRAIVSAALNGDIEGTEIDSLGFRIPKYVKGVPPKALRAENYWDTFKDYEDQARQLVSKFDANASQFSGKVDREVLEAGPHFLGAAIYRGGIIP